MYIYIYNTSIYIYIYTHIFLLTVASLHLLQASLPASPRYARQKLDSLRPVPEASQKAQL